MSLFFKFSNLSRIRKLELFQKTFTPTGEMKILDLGAEIKFTSYNQMQFIDGYAWKKNISAINISKDHIATIKRHYPEINAVVGDACNLPWPDKFFDIVHCNAVIEHVGDFEKQKKMAREIMRVGKEWFVTTPNRWYPFEFHLRLPFVTWLPGSFYLLASRIVQFNHVKKRYIFFGQKVKNLRLLSTKEMKSCFPDSKIITQKVTFWPETIIAIKNKFKE